MRLTNYSEKDTGELKRLAKWVASRMKGDHAKTRAIIYNWAQAGAPIGKMDAKFGLISLFGGLAATGWTPAGANRVLFQFGSRTKFPYTSEYVKGMKVKFKDWQEEFVMYMAHELFHVEQYRRDGPNMIEERGTRVIEKEAETHAFKVIAEFRKDRKKIYNEKESPKPKSKPARPRVHSTRTPRKPNKPGRKGTATKPNKSRARKTS